MCEKCYGRGVTYSQVFAGVYQLNSCTCEYSIQHRQASEQKMKEYRHRLEVAYQSFYQKQGELVEQT